MEAGELILRFMEFFY